MAHRALAEEHHALAVVHHARAGAHHALAVVHHDELAEVCGEEQLRVAAATHELVRHALVVHSARSVPTCEHVAFHMAVAHYGGATQAEVRLEEVGCHAEPHSSGNSAEHSASAGGNLEVACHSSQEAPPVVRQEADTLQVVSCGQAQAAGNLARAALDALEADGALDLEVANK